MPNAEVIYVPPPRQERLPLFWSGMGEQTRKSARYRWNGLRRGTEDHLLWQLTLSGCGWIRIGSNPPVKLGPGSGFMARFPSNHCYYYQSGDPAWHFIWVSWTGPSLRAIWKAMSPVPARIITMNPGEPAIGYIRSMLRSGATHPTNSRRNSVAAYRLLLEVARSSPRPPPPSPRVPMVLPKLSRALRRSPNSPIGKKGLATHLELSRFQLYRSLKREMGLSPKEWALRERLERSFRLLKQTRIPISLVALKVGIPDANYFTRFFRKRTGFTPRDWRGLFGQK